MRNKLMLALAIIAPLSGLYATTASAKDIATFDCGLDNPLLTDADSDFAFYGGEFFKVVDERKQNLSDGRTIAVIKYQQYFKSTHKLGAESFLFVAGLDQNSGGMVGVQMDGKYHPCIMTSEDKD